MNRKLDSARKMPLKREIKEILGADRDLLKRLVTETPQQTLEVEMEEALAAEKSERTPDRLGHRSGYYDRTLVTRVGKIELRVPQDRRGRFRTEVFLALPAQRESTSHGHDGDVLTGVSTRKVEAITEELCGHEFSSSSVSRIVAKLDQELEKFSRRRLEEDYPYLILDARYEKVREDGAVRSQAVLVAIAIDWEGRPNVLFCQLVLAKTDQRIDALSSVHRLDCHQHPHLRCDLNHRSASRHATKSFDQSGGTEPFHWILIVDPRDEVNSIRHSS